MSNWTWLLISFVLAGNGQDRSVLFFTSQTCGPCRKIYPVVEELKSEGLSIRSIDIDVDPSTASRYRVSQVPTLVVLDNGREVDRVIGAMPASDLKLRLLGDIPDNARNTLEAEMPNREAARPRVGSNFGPNHPMFRAKSRSDFGPNHPRYQPIFRSEQASATYAVLPREESLAPSLGVNHPYYGRANKTRINNRESYSEKRTPRKSIGLPTGVKLPELPETMAASVRIRIQRDDDISVGTGTIIDADKDEAIVLTCGHLFRGNQADSGLKLEIFQNGKILSVPGTLMDFRNDDLDLGLVKFRPPVAVTKVKLIPKGEELREEQPVISIGCDSGEDPSRRESVITKLNRFLGPSNLEVAGAPVQGRSGGGLFDVKGRLIGVCIAADNDLDEGMYVAPEAIYEWLKDIGLERLAK